ncbi:MAG: hypothetical protein V3U33_04925, partial [candidate division NC10 bacterium]
VKSRVIAALSATHLIQVSLADMEMTADDGAYLGRWSFHLTPAEVAGGRADVIRNWYQGRSIQAEVSVTKVLLGGTEATLQEVYGVDTFVSVLSAIDESFPEGLEQYVYNIEGGWRTLFRTGPIHDPPSSLLLYSFGVHYSDLLFNLYAIIWWDDLAYLYPNAAPSSITLVDTNIIPLPTSQGGETDGQGEESGTDAGGQNETGIVGPGDSLGLASLPWLPVILFAAVAIVITAVAYQRFRPRSGVRRRGGGRGRPLR